MSLSLVRVDFSVLPKNKVFLFYFLFFCSIEDKKYGFSQLSIVLTNLRRRRRGREGRKRKGKERKVKRKRKKIEREGEREKGEFFQ